MYEYTDKQLSLAKRKIRSEFNRIQKLPLDQISISETRKLTKQMYKSLVDSNAEIYERIANKAYRDALRSAGKKKSDSKDKKLGAKWVALLLAAYNPITGYLYESETDRKRLRLFEQMLTAKEFHSRQMLREYAKTAANLWWTQTEQYGVGITDAATMQAYVDVGVKRVRWNTQNDGKECKTCKERDQKVYRIEDAPAKAHYRCRCYYTPVLEMEGDASGD